MSGTLPRSVRFGYATGSVATGAFGTVPGLMLLPFLTDSLGIAALGAGAIVFLPKAWDVVLNPIAGRISDRTVDARGPRRPWLLRGGLGLAVAFALLFAGPDLDSVWLDAGWVLVCFLGCATAYAFFQVPYVAMPRKQTSTQPASSQREPRSGPAKSRANAAASARPPRSSHAVSYTHLTLPTICSV